jgi:hypothetical protein
MNPAWGWALAIAALAAGAWSYGWPGLALAASVISFWLLLQFNRVVRVMQAAGRSPVGVVPSVVMLQSRLSNGMTLAQVLAQSRSLGERVSGHGEVYRWSDASGITLVADFDRGRLTAWQLTRPPESPVDSAAVAESTGACGLATQPGGTRPED